MFWIILIGTIVIVYGGIQAVYRHGIVLVSVVIFVLYRLFIAK